MVINKQIKIITSTKKLKLYNVLLHIHFCKQQICTRQIGSVRISVAWRGAWGQSGTQNIIGLHFLWIHARGWHVHNQFVLFLSPFLEMLIPLFSAPQLTSHHCPHPSLKYAVPMMLLSALTDVVAYPSQFLPSLFLPPSLLGVRLPPHGLPLLRPVGGTSVAAPARHPHLVSAPQHWTMFLLTSRLTVLKS